MYVSEYENVPAIELPIHEAVLGQAAARGEAPALIDGVDGTVVSYAQLDAFHRRVAAGLAAAGLTKGDVLALHSPNTLAFPMAFYGATRAGASVTTVHPLATAEEFAKQLRDSGASWIVTVSPLLATARAAAELAGGIREIMVCDRAEGHQSLLGMLAVPEETAAEPRVTVDPVHDIAVLPYSSGTTGAPKGVMLTHRSIATNLAQLYPLMPVTAEDRILAVLPFFHIYGLTALLNSPLRHGASVVVLPRFDLETFLKAIQDQRITGLYIAPPIALALAKHPSVDDYDLSSVRYAISAAAPLDAELARACGARLGIGPIAQAYGMTELSPGTHVVPLGARDVPPGTVGKLVAGTEMRVVDEDGRDLGPGERGELLFRGPQVMKGYLGRPEDTGAMIDPEGWLHTGDIGQVDSDGWLFVVDRVKELIKYKGYQVAPAELEALLLTHDAVADAAVIGVQEPDGTEIPLACVVRAPGADDLDAEQVMAYVAARVAPYKKVRRVEFVASVPRAVSGKILRRELREVYGKLAVPGEQSVPGEQPVPSE
ncbi:4-coumarate--CoA ligase family protein [Streptomyces sp. NA04227]|uniref:4-coumarate--CoA ligase family protein n=1 Tax=Streptomyces sp. NA04227 TaxID=2742136 RepID=UPI0015901684|nr:4-coumarate--CoA ligase family protein [Streptomyces sp. NA04227]QKW10835.1 4-coumarate--CoA ligase family protein [Streptomyces sp. NA04227]